MNRGLQPITDYLPFYFVNPYTNNNNNNNNNNNHMIVLNTRDWLEKQW